MRYIDDFVVCFQYREDAVKFHDVLKKRLGKFSLMLEPTKTKLIEFGRFALENAKKKGKKPETLYFLGFTHYCTSTRAGQFRVGRKTEKFRFRRSLSNLKETMRKIRHWSIDDQARKINQILRGHFAYYGMGGNFRALNNVYHHTRRFWRKALCRRSQKGRIKWSDFDKLFSEYPLQKPKIFVPYARMKEIAVL